MYEISVNETPVKIWASAVDPHAWKEIMNLASLPFVFHHLAFMPDLHGGKGMPIGGVLATKDVIIPNAVGVDIGCGMCAVKTSWKVSDIAFEPMINIAHNYAAIENHFGENVFVHRKGAVRARAGEVGIIPGSQGTKSYIVEGLGNPDSFESSSHVAVIKGV